MNALAKSLPLALFSIPLAIFATVPAQVALPTFSLEPKSAPDQSRTSESFNSQWKFAKFGFQADGTPTPEPGNPAFAIAATASSAETSNPASLAFDNNPDTRWCANNGSPSQHVVLAFPQPTQIGKISISWESEKNGYRYQILTSQNGSDWQPAATGQDNAPTNVQKTARFLKIQITELPQGSWASIREISLESPNGQKITQQTLPSSSPTAEQITFNDQTWRTLNLPHDWGIEGPFTFANPGETGHLPWPGIGWYRKSFPASPNWKNRRVFLEFDGAMARSQVFLNGKLLNSRPYGYASFQVELTENLSWDRPNVLAVRLDSKPDSSRWYPGAGINRNVRLVTTGKIRVPFSGQQITTPQINEHQATAEIVTEIENPTDQTQSVRVQTRVISLGIAALGKPSLVAQPQTTQISLPPHTPKTLVTQKITIPKPQLWSPEQPFLYTTQTQILSGNTPQDTVRNEFGIRTTTFDPNQGLLVNGQKIYMKGVCMHSDVGALGAIANTRAIQRQLEILKAMGCNAIRTSHNPPVPELLQLCDRMGFLVMDESFDCWQNAKKSNDYSRDFATWHTRDLTDFIRRDRNHPSVIFWSVGNEIPEAGGNSPNLKLAQELIDTVSALDPTRLTSIGCDSPNSGWNGIEKIVGLFGYNYKPHLYRDWLAKNPNRVFFGSETSSCVSSRGIYFFPVSDDKSRGAFNFQVSSYDLYAPGWAYPPDVEFKAQDENPRVAGEFVWTGFDYLGEPTPYNLDQSTLTNFHTEAERAAYQKTLEKIGNKPPARSSYFGIVDLAGFPKDRFFSYQARWNPTQHVAHLFPHWTWPDRVGQVTPVHAYLSGDEAELFLNGKSLGRKKRAKYEYRLRWDDVVYQPGELKLVTYKNGKKDAETVQKTAGKPAKLEVTVDRPSISADGQDLAYVTVRVLDANGIFVPNADIPLTFSSTGSAEFLASDNGNAISWESFQSPNRLTFSGMALGIFRAKSTPGNATITVSSPNLPNQTISFSVK